MSCLKIVLISSLSLVTNVSTPSESIFEKPIYSPSVTFTTNHSTDSHRALLLWKNSKVAIFAAHDDNLSALIANGSVWKCIYIDEITDVGQFLRAIEV